MKSGSYKAVDIMVDDNFIDYVSVSPLRRPRTREQLLRRYRGRESDVDMAFEQLTNETLFDRMSNEQKVSLRERIFETLSDLD